MKSKAQRIRELTDALVRVRQALEFPYNATHRQVAAANVKAYKIALDAVRPRRGPMPALTKPQLEALKLLAVEPRETSKTTAHGWIAGVVMQALERKGFARRVPRPVSEVTTASAWSASKYQITDAGREALAQP